MSNLVIQLGLRSAACLLVWFVAAQDVHAIVTSTIGGTHHVYPGQSSYDLNLDGVGLFGFPMPGSDDIADVLPVCTDVGGPVHRRGIFESIQDGFTRHSCWWLVK